MAGGGQLRLSIYVHQTRGAYWAYCPEFGLTASGSSAEEAHDAVVTLIGEYLDQVQRQPGDRARGPDSPVEWDSALISGGLDQDRTLN